ncbi:3-hydroxyacyl-CoA dehydrogenase type-2, partial [Stegodyphus mimosarum]
MSSTIRSVKGLVVLVTGGAGGLGKGTAERLVRNGASVVICDLPSSNGQNFADELGQNCIFVPTDISKESDVQEALRITKEKFHKLDAVVNCAAILKYIPVYDFKKEVPHPLEDFMKIISVNLAGSFNVIRLAVGLMAKNRPDQDGQKGVIINTSSLAAFDGMPGVSAYGASKAGLIGMTLPLARDLESEGIRVVTISPGTFDTPLVNVVPKEDIKVITKSIPFPQRLGKPDEYAHLVQTIIENPMLNGCEIRIDAAARCPFFRND